MPLQPLKSMGDKKPSCDGNGDFYRTWGMLKNPLLSLSDQGNGTAHDTNLSQGVINEQVTGIREGRDPLDHSGSPSGQKRSDSSSISSTDQPSRHHAPNQPLLRALFILLIYKAFSERQLKAVR